MTRRNEGEQRKSCDLRAISRRDVLRVGGAAGGILVAGCLDSGANTTDQLEIVVSSKTYTEQILLGYLAYTLLNQNTDHTLVDRTELGSNEAHANAYQSGDIHAYYDYMGSLWADHPPVHETSIADSDELHAALVDEMESTHPIQILDHADWENTWAPFAHREAVEGTSIETLSDLAVYVNGGNYDITLAFEDDFVGREDGLENLLEHYRFEDEHVDAWREQGGFNRVVSPSAVGVAIEQGQADAGIGYGTSAWLASLDDIVFLEDDTDFWPPFHPVGVVQDDVATDEVIAELNKMPEAIPDGETMRQLNSRVDIEGQAPQDVMFDHLTEQGLI